VRSVPTLCFAGFAAMDEALPVQVRYHGEPRNGMVTYLKKAKRIHGYSELVVQRIRLVGWWRPALDVDPTFPPFQHTPCWKNAC